MVLHANFVCELKIRIEKKMNLLKTALLRCWATENKKWGHKQKLGSHECPKNRQNR